MPRIFVICYLFQVQISLVLSSFYLVKKFQFVPLSFVCVYLCGFVIPLEKCMYIDLAIPIE